MYRPHQATAFLLFLFLLFFFVFCLTLLLVANRPSVMENSETLTGDAGTYLSWLPTLGQIPNALHLSQLD